MDAWSRWPKFLIELNLVKIPRRMLFGFWDLELNLVKIPRRMWFGFWMGCVQGNFHSPALAWAGEAEGSVIRPASGM
jgi:hypothetical protein